MEEKIVYFENPGEGNTAEVLKLAKERAAARGIKKVVLASTRGNTARAAVEAFSGSDIKLVVVPWQFGFSEVQPFPPELVAELESQGHKVHFGTMLFHAENLYGSKVPRALADLLRAFSQGFKVGMEVLLMATDGGKVDIGEKVMVLAGTGAGTDTAFVATAAASSQLGKLHVSEIVCKPL